MNPGACEQDDGDRASDTAGAMRRAWRRLLSLGSSDNGEPQNSAAELNAYQVSQANSAGDSGRSVPSHGDEIGATWVARGIPSHENGASLKEASSGERDSNNLRDLAKDPAEVVDDSDDLLLAPEMNRESDDPAVSALSTSNSLSAPAKSSDSLYDRTSTSAEEDETLKEEIARLLNHQEALTLKISSVEDANTKLHSQLSNSKERLVALKERLDRANSAVDTIREQRDNAVARNKQTAEKLLAFKEVTAERRAKLLGSLNSARENLILKTALWDEAKKYFALFRQGLLFDEIDKSDVDLRADTYLCLLPSTVPAALALSKKYGGRVICDCVENVEVHRQSLAPKLRPAALEMINLSAYGSLTAVDGLMTVSNSVARTLERFGPSVRVQPNYRRYEEPVSNGKLRELCGVQPDATMLVTTGNIVNRFESVLDALRLLPENVHLAAFVQISPPEYRQRVTDYIDELGLADRVHLHGFVPYAELAGLLADADIGLITLDPDNPNHAVSLPNRVFDFTTAGLPFVAPPIPEIETFVAEHGNGLTLREASAEAWADAVVSMLSDLPEYRKQMEAARRRVTWESMDDELHQFLGNPRTVTMLGFRDLSRYQRFLRVTDSLTSRGVKVKAAFFSEDPLPIKNSDAEYYHFSNRYGMGDGLVRVPLESEIHVDNA